MGQNYNYNLSEQSKNFSTIKELSIFEINIAFSQMKSRIDLLEKELIVKNKTYEKIEIKIGPFAYKSKVIYCNESILKLPPQVFKLFILFMNRPDEFISFSSMQETLAIYGYVTKLNIQKLLSRLRQLVNTQKIKIQIKPREDGYIFITKNLR